VLFLLPGGDVVDDDLALLGVVQQDLGQVLRSKRRKVVVPPGLGGAAGFGGVEVDGRARGCDRHRPPEHHVLPGDLAVGIERKGVGGFVDPGRRALPHQEHLRARRGLVLHPDHRCVQRRQIGQLGEQAHKRLADPGQPLVLVLRPGAHVVGDDLAVLGVVEQDLLHVLRRERGEVVVPAGLDLRDAGA